MALFKKTKRTVKRKTIREETDGDKFVVTVGKCKRCRLMKLAF